jgi:formylglycine-generating enzyme required for sulfatase activity
MASEFLFPFTPGLFSAAVWIPESGRKLEVHAQTIARPSREGDRDAWLGAMREYRREIRSGTGDAVARLSPSDGDWICVAPQLSEAYDLRPGETVRIRVVARAVSGDAELRAAFNVFHRRERTWADWPISGGAPCRFIAHEGWTDLVWEVIVPEFDSARFMVYPMIGGVTGALEVRHLELEVDDPARMAAVGAVFASAPRSRALDLAIYDRDDLRWAASAFTSHMTFMYDQGFYDASSGRYLLDEHLDEGVREFGGYDAILLWHAYPRIGVDDRNQFDFFRDMPGGLEGLRQLCGRAHARGVRVFINYNPWDTGTRREGVTDEEALADLVAAIDADGIFLDTMGGGSSRLREQVDLRRPGVVFEPEGHPDIHQLGVCNSSWAQYHADPDPPGILHLKWIEPRHMQRMIRRWEKSHREEIESALFNGAGMLVWENVFGTVNLWSDADRALWQRASGVLRHFAAAFRTDDWEPFHPTVAQGLHANRWPLEGMDLFTLVNRGQPLCHAALLRVPAREGLAFLNLWDGTELATSTDAGVTTLTGSVDHLAALLVVRADMVDQPLRDLMARQRAAAVTPRADAARGAVLPVVEPMPAERTTPAVDAPAGMVRIPGGAFTMRIEHEARECNCYPDPGASREEWPEFLERCVTGPTVKHEIGPMDLPPYLIDEKQVTNREYRRFLTESGYAPHHRENFLKYWPDGAMPEILADHPVVYVDLDDARAYARWVGKRLPTEAEWQFAAQGAAGNKWPWGAEFDPRLCNMTGTGTMPALSLPEGRSPFGCHHMSGNVWEWTESERCDGHTRFVMIRGGSFHKAEGSVWYAPGGPMPCDHHAKFILMWPGLDRCATIGFRCVRDCALRQ